MPEAAEAHRYVVAREAPARDTIKFVTQNRTKTPQSPNSELCLHAYLCHDQETYVD